MKVTVDSTGRVEINLQTRGTGGVTAVNQFVDDPNVEVYYGSLHARVWLKDLGLQITMDSEPGEWNDAKWARERALTSLVSALSADNIGAFLSTIVASVRKLGHRNGVASAQQLMRIALGLTSNEDD